MLTITPIAAATGLASYDPSRWGGEINIINIIGLAVFGLLSVPLWFTYIPTLILTPIIMKRLSDKENFYSISIWKFYSTSVQCGIIAGLFILSPSILLSASESIDITLNWVWSGIVTGGVTFPIISSMYRFIKPKHFQTSTQTPE